MGLFFLLPLNYGAGKSFCDIILQKGEIFASCSAGKHTRGKKAPVTAHAFADGAAEYNYIVGCYFGWICGGGVFADAIAG